MASEIEVLVIEIEQRVQNAHPDVVAMFIKPQTPGAYSENIERRLGKMD